MSCNIFSTNNIITVFGIEQILKFVWWIMDRRQLKTRQAIFNAFTSLLSKKTFSSITVSEILEIANVGRATFYAHFETKDYLLKELCKELFDHVFEAETGSNHAHDHIFDCDETGSVFLHLFKHLENNDNNVAKLLSCENNEIFMQYFKNSLKALVYEHINQFKEKKKASLPDDFLINHVSSSFVETAKWWIDGGRKLPAKTINEYFMQTV